MKLPRGRHVRGVAAILALLAVPQVAIGQTADAGPSNASIPADALVAPRLISPLAPTYPAGATGDARVVLRITVDAFGTVKGSTTLEGTEPFATEALRVARTAKFAPATRAGRPVAAAIRLEVLFEAPRIVAPGPAVAEGEGTPTAPAPKVALDAPEEVVVRGAKELAPAVQSMGRAEVRELPGAFGDPFRALDALPGVTPIISGLPYFYVRGSPPGNVGYYLDGVRVPYLFHFGLGPSVINPGLVERVDLYPGAFPAAFGRYAGAIVSAETVRPQGRWHGEGNVRLFDAGAIVEAPFANGKGSVLLGGRYAYTAALLSLVAGEVQIDYRDYQARVAYDIGDRDTLSVFAFGAFDLAANTPKNKPKEVLFASEFHRVDLRYDRILPHGGAARMAVAFGLDRSRFESNRFARDFPLILRGGVVDIPLGTTAKVRAGIDATLDFIDADPSSRYSDSDESYEQEQQVFAARTDFAVGAHADVVWRPFRALELTPGMRVDVFGSRGNTALAIEPRYASRVFLGNRVRVVHTAGVHHQPPAFIAPIPGLSIAGLPGGLQSSVHTAAGIEADLPQEIAGTIYLFHNAFLSMNDPLGLATSGELDGFDSFFKRSRGSSMGLEVSLKRKLTKRLGGLLGYTLSRSQRSFQRFTGLSSFDRTHVLNAAITFDMGAGWRAGARFLYYTGIPVRDQASAIVPPGVAAVIPERTEAFPRLDARVEKKWLFSKTTFLSLVIEGLNVTLSRESLGYGCNGSDGTCGPKYFGPVTVPSIGLEGGF